MTTGNRKTAGQGACILGVGAMTALGTNMASSAAAVRAGISGFSDHSYMVDEAGESMVTARVPDLSDNYTGPERFVHLAIQAAAEAVSSLPPDRGRSPVPIVIGLPVTRPGRPEGLDTLLEMKLRQALSGSFPVATVRTVPGGHSAGLMALEMAWRQITESGLECCLVGGVDSYHNPDTLAWLDDLEQLHSTTNKWGFIPGEGAGFILLGSAAFAERAKMAILGTAITVATAAEKNLIKTETVCTGEGLSAAVRHVLKSLPPDDKIDQIICDLNGERYRADEWGYTITRTADRYVDPSDFLAPADCWGDVGAASGLLSIGLAVVAGQKGYARGPHTLVWTSSEGGERSAALVRVEPIERKA